MMQIKIKPQNSLVCNGMMVEPGLPNGFSALHLSFEDPEGITHHAGFAVRNIYVDAVTKVCSRMRPIKNTPTENQPADTTGAGEDDGAGNTGTGLDSQTGRSGRAQISGPDEMGAGVSGGPGVPVPALSGAIGDLSTG